MRSLRVSEDQSKPRDITDYNKKLDQSIILNNPNSNEQNSNRQSRNYYFES